jgi:hypothetical protein
MKRPSDAAAIALWNAGRSFNRSRMVRLEIPMPSAPAALPMAMSARRLPEPSCRLSSTMLPPVSSTATVSGSSLASALALNVASAIFSAVESGIETCRRWT